MKKFCITFKKRKLVSFPVKLEVKRIRNFFQEFISSNKAQLQKFKCLSRIFLQNILTNCLRESPCTWRKKLYEFLKHIIGEKSRKKAGEKNMFLAEEHQAVDRLEYSDLVGGSPGNTAICQRRCRPSAFKMALEKEELVYTSCGLQCIKQWIFVIFFKILEHFNSMIVI